MKDGSAGGILAFIVAAPVVVICCGGHAAVLASMLSGAIGTATGLDILTILLIAVGVGVGYLDYVLMPALAVFVLITIYALIRRAPNTNS